MIKIIVNDAKWWKTTGKEMFEEFNSWLGDVNADSRIAVREHVKSNKYKSLLDVACASAIDYEGYKGYEIEYHGYDMTPEFLARANPNVITKVGSIEELPYEDNSIDVVIARHILEHLDYYEKAVKECLRVAKHEAIFVFYKRPLNKEKITQMPEGYFDNLYSKNKLESFLKSLGYTKLKWEYPDKRETILIVKKS